MNLFDSLFGGGENCDEVDAISVSGGPSRRWFASPGVSKTGRVTVVNSLASSQSEADAIHQGLGIAYGLSSHQKAEDIGSESDYRDID